MRFLRLREYIRKTPVSAMALLVIIVALGVIQTPVHAAACTASTATVTKTSSPVFYIDDPTYNQAYASFQVSSGASGAFTDLWVKIDSFTNTSLLGPAASEDGLYHVGALSANSSTNVYFLLKGAATASAQSYTLHLYEGKPGTGGTENCTSAQSNTSVSSTIEANSNSVSSVSYTAPYIGSDFTMTVIGDTGTIGSAGIFSYTPASQTTWNADCLELKGTSITMTGGNTGTFTGGLYRSGLNSSTTHYTITYTFTAKCVTSSTTPVVPLSYISSGTQVKHTSVSNYGTLPPIAPATNSLVMTKEVSPAATISGGTATYTLDITNNGPSTATIDDIRDILPSSPATVTYTSNSTTYDNDTSDGTAAASISNPTTSGQTLTWVRSFSIPSGKTAQLKYQATIPSTSGSYVNSAVAHSGSTQIDLTADTSDNRPATATYGVGDPSMAASTKDASDINGGTLQPGDIIEYTISAKATGTNDATGVHISDTIDSNTNSLTDVIIGANGTDCGNNYSNNTTATALDVTNVTVTHGGSCDITFQATVKSSTAAGTTILNSASIVPSNLGGISGSPSSVPMIVHKDPILNVTNTENDADNVVLANQVITYTTTITNTGQSDASGVDLSGSISGPVGSIGTRTFTNCGPSTTYVDTSSGTTLAIAALTVTTSNPCVISYTVTVNSGATTGSVTNTVNVGAAREGGNDPAPVNASTLLIGAAPTPPNLSATMSHNDADGFVGPGQAVTYTMNIQNSGQTDATTSLTVAIPSGMSTPGSLQYTNCGSPGSSFSAPTLSVSSISISAANTCTIKFTTTVSSPQNEGTTLVASVDVAQASQGGNNPSAVNAPTLTIDATPFLAITSAENDADNSVAPGQDVTYTITITNTGDGQATGVPLTDTFTGPVGSPSNFSLSNCGSSYSNSSTSSVSISDLTIDVGTPCIVTFHVAVNSNATSGNTISDTANITGANEGGNNPVPVSASTLTVSALPVLGVTSAEDDADNSVTPGQTITYTVTLTNSGSGNASGVSLDDPISGSVGDVHSVNLSGCGSSSNNTSSGTTLHLAGLTIGTAADCVVTFQVTVNSNAAGGGSITDSADASAATEGGNNPAAVSASTLTVATVPNLGVTVGDNDIDNSVTPGQTLQFTLTITNSGNGTATTSADATIPSALGSPSSIVFAHCGSASTSFASGVLHLTSLSITTSDACVITFNAAVDSPNTEGAQFVVAVDVAQANQGGNNPSSVDSATFTINTTPNLSTSTYTLSDANGSILAPGDTINYTLTLKNTGDGQATGVDLTSTINLNTTFDPSTISLDHCGSPTDTSDTTSLNLTNLTIAVGTNCVITFSTTVNSPMDEGTAISQTADITAASEGGTGASLATSSLNVDATPNLVVSFTDNDVDNTVTPGQNIQYTLTIANSGNGIGTTNAEITIPSGMTAPTSVTFNHCTSTTSAYTAPTLTLSNLRISTDSDCTVTFTVQVTSPSTEGLTLVPTADIAAATEGGNNPAAVPADSLSVDVTPSLSVSIADDDTDNTVSLSQVVNMTLAITNTGNGKSTGVPLSYTLSGPGGSIANISTAGCGSNSDETHTSTTLHYTNLEVSVGTTCEIHFTFTVAGNASNGATITQVADVGNATEGGNDAAAVNASTLTVDTSNAAPQIPSDVASSKLIGNHFLNTASIQGAAVDMSLSDPNGSDQVRYRLQISSDATFSAIAIDYRSVLGTQGSHTFTYQENTGIYLMGSSSMTLPDGDYYLRVRAEDEHGASSGWYTAVDKAFVYDTTSPATPDKPYTIGTIGDGTVRVGWDPTLDSSPHSLIPYRLEVSSRADFATFTELDTADLSSIFNDIQPGTHRYFRLYLRDGAGNLSTASAVLDVLMPAAGGTVVSPPHQTPRTHTAHSLATTPQRPASTARIPSQTTIAIPQPKPQEGSRPDKHKETTKVAVLAKDWQGRVIEGAKVTLHSEPRVAYTDHSGKVLFTDVPIGNHTVTVEYRGMVASALVSLNAGVEEVHLNLVLKNTQNKSIGAQFHCYWLWWLLLLVLVILIWWYYRRRARRSQLASYAKKHS